ncbi:MAG: 30S ribosomal protein S8 [Deltaproteobacteria bacterium]|jgi:small subunit ribosomal protein S8|nr:30S ribosomal protein S8 [Deltaproteobacteria bacterium]MBK8241461.1 30S ribosomal protein S8 [Deltaproteobacteria bacterium]MBK8717173.1 30S ribosomal protein S8 [Deltaproteobacteria bacterium]MBP7286303.1 30S ribosomal protein S8 [Nannocystaceae bacterium]
MSMTDPIADMLTRIRNAVAAKHRSLVLPGSKLKLRLGQILKEEGYIEDVTWKPEGPQGAIEINLRFREGQSAIEGLQRISRPGQRRYASHDEIPKIRNGLGILIVSTSRGMMTDRAARKAGVGGELVCSIW